MVASLVRAFGRAPARSFAAAAGKQKICMVGSGNFGSALVRILGRNALKHDIFDSEVKMYVHEEMIDGKPLTQIINETNENVKYQKGAKFTPNVVADPDISSAVSGATMVCFCLPHQFLKPMVPKIKAAAAPGVKCLSAIKGIDFDDNARQPRPCHLASAVRQHALSLCVRRMCYARATSTAGYCAHLRHSPRGAPGGLLGAYGRQRGQRHGLRCLLRDHHWLHQRRQRRALQAGIRRSSSQGGNCQGYGRCRAMRRPQEHCRHRRRSAQRRRRCRRLRREL